MRSLFFIIYFSLHFGHVFSQQFVRIPTDTNYFWIQVSTCNYKYQLRYYKDTVINSKIYNKYACFGGTTGSAPCASFISNVFLRQDSIAKKVMILDPIFNERPLYNFSKIAGDTLQIYDRLNNINSTYTVQMVVTGAQILIDSLGYAQYIFPGQGSHEGGLYASRQYYAGPSGFERLVCYGKISPFQILAPPEVGSEGICYLSTDIKVNSSQNQLMKIYPNPLRDKLSIEIGSFSETYELNISDALGQSIYHFKNLKAKQELDLSSLAGGLYILTIKNNGGQKTIKLVKE